MEVEILQATDDAEKLVCQAARGDYSSEFVGDVEYRELMDSVSHESRHEQRVLRMNDEPVERFGAFVREEAKTLAFIEKQLSRGHYGPWEHPSITFAVKGISRVTMAQITRHRHMSFDVQSMRYVDFEDQDIVTPRSLTDDEHFSREDGLTEVEEREEALQMYEEKVEDMVEVYRELVESGVPKEDARFALPLGMSVNMTLSGNARTMMHLMDMRRNAAAQWEVRELSDLMVEHLQRWMPYTFSEYEDKGPNKLAP